MVFIILVGGGYYGYTWNQVGQAAQDTLLSLEIYDYEIENLSLVPPSVDVNFIYQMYNPSGYSFNLTLVMDLYIGDTFISECDSSCLVSPMSVSTISIPVHITSSVTEVISEPELEPALRGQVTVTHYILGLIPVTVTENFVRE